MCHPRAVQTTVSPVCGALRKHHAAAGMMATGARAQAVSSCLGLRHTRREGARGTQTCVCARVSSVSQDTVTCAIRPARVRGWTRPEHPCPEGDPSPGPQTSHYIPPCTRARPGGRALTARIHDSNTEHRFAAVLSHHSDRLEMPATFNFIS